ncbi:DUF3300 domain-containing protein [Lacimicrobium alkaliphilum]|uniref:DUF3300 domain-containing protein n=1 Tax=Lacimicrobium alkaliphilum TaxID=1526571 RepID=A0A0U3B236_9ALTE|nr:DUF3300 domain-containing protein [Lacimicrobium alkaliphilum]ALS99120.1 hypothetical protein AT746_13160 [Lacimicrobium alkaliphilum]
MPVLPYWKAHLRALIILLLTMVLVSVTQASEPDEQLDKAELDSLLAPIALYPDTLLSHILIAASYPLEVVQASRWREQHQRLDESDIINAAEDQDWDPSVKALLPFEDVLTRMSEDLEWTQGLGEVFLADEELVLARIQVLRRKAYEAGNLYSNEHVEVEPEPEVIRIETVRKEVVYVPYYDTRVVYGDWWWAHHAPHYWHHPYATASVNIFWGPRITVRPYFYFSNFHWRNRYVVVNNHHFYQRPRYYPRQTVIIRDGKRWQHNNKHRRGVRYQNPVVHRKIVNQRVSLSREAQQRPARAVSTKHRAVSTVPRAVSSKESVRHRQAVQNKLQNQSKMQKRIHKTTNPVKQNHNSANNAVNSHTRNAIRRADGMGPKPLHREHRAAAPTKQKSAPQHKGNRTEVINRSRIHSKQRAQSSPRPHNSSPRARQPKAVQNVQQTKPAGHVRNTDRPRVQKH